MSHRAGRRFFEVRRAGVCAAVDCLFCACLVLRVSEPTATRGGLPCADAVVVHRHGETAERLGAVVMTAQDLQVAGRRRATVSERDDVVEVAAPFGAAGAMGEATLPVAQADCASGRRIGTVRAAGRGDDLWAAVEEVTRQFGDEPRVHPGRQVSDDASRHDTETRHHDGTQGPRRAVVRPVVHHRTGSSAPRRWAPAFVRSASMPDATSGSRCCSSCRMARTAGMRASPCAAARATAGAAA